MPRTLKTGWYRKDTNDYLFVWGSAEDREDHKHRAIFIQTAGSYACRVQSLEVTVFVEYLALRHYRHTKEAPSTLPPDFPTNLFVNKLA